MALSTPTIKNTLATSYGTACPYASLHTANPGTTGASEVTGGAPAYARKAVTWGAASNGVITGQVTFDVPTGITVAYAGLWSALTAGTFQDGGAVTSQAFSTQGQYTLTLTYTQS